MLSTTHQKAWDKASETEHIIFQIRSEWVEDRERQSDILWHELSHSFEWWELNLWNTIFRQVEADHMILCSAHGLMLRVRRAAISNFEVQMWSDEESMKSRTRNKTNEECEQKKNKQEDVVKEYKDRHWAK